MGYLKATGQLTPEKEAALEAAISQGYQRLLTFEAESGGFAWYGRGQASALLTAYGLLVLSDMDRLHPVDEALVARARSFLSSHRRQDGSWAPDPRGQSWRPIEDDFAATAYVTWTLLEAGASEPAGVAHLEANYAKAADAHTRALVANVLVMAKSPLAARAIEDLGDATGWNDVETSALATLALLRHGGSSLAENALVGLVRAKDPQGGWHSTQATIVAIKALLADRASNPSGDVAVRVNGHPVAFDPADADVVRQADVTQLARKGDNEIEITCDAIVSVQVTGRYWTPWPSSSTPDEETSLAIETRYDTHRPARGQRVRGEVALRYRGDDTFMVIADLGVPPGFDVEPAIFERMVRQGQIDKFALQGDRIVLYLGAVAGGHELRFSYVLRPRYSGVMKAPATRVYEYYAPQRCAVAAPEMLEVTP
ncbi:MAG: hypothetical protein HYY16_06560 [Planctomycetes bacterium]|nr:hypothetical protein [Planctomycetota bacterium]